MGEGLVVRSDDIDGNDVLGTVTTPDGVVRHYRANCTDDCQIIGAEIDPA